MPQATGLGRVNCSTKVLIHRRMICINPPKVVGNASASKENRVFGKQPILSFDLGQQILRPALSYNCKTAGARMCLPDYINKKELGIQSSHGLLDIHQCRRLPI